ncbi:hypothetical protein BDY24DRAFT_358926 [Mrakia frigida]|uniref:uncharacterized protein n=1 Tax=Mrakia frigida TaxID=29902 RepID=UPI003FCC23C4
MATGTSLDIFHEIKIDHENVRDLYNRFKVAEFDEQKLAIVNTLVREIVVHLEAGEVTLYKMLREKGMVVEELKLDQETHSRIISLVAAADSAKLNDPSYNSKVDKAFEAFLDHAQMEEEFQLPSLEMQMLQTENAKLTQDFLKARTTVPHHPHSFVPHSGGAVEKVALATAKAEDAIADAINRKREFVVLAQEHATFH